MKKDTTYTFTGPHHHLFLEHPILSFFPPTLLPPPSRGSESSRPPSLSHPHPCRNPSDFRDHHDFDLQQILHDLEGFSEPGMSTPAGSKKGEEGIQIREVWADNLEAEFELIRKVVDEYTYVAMDTEFPGVVLRPLGQFKTTSELNYQTLKANVDLLKLIQLGLTFSDEDGNLPSFDASERRGCIWQFNFREFNPEVDMFANDSIELLRHSGIDLIANRENGVDAQRFGELLMSSGVVLNDNVQWVTFHSGYDFGYLIKILTCRNLPESQNEFFDLINMFFPVIYDIKHLMRFSNSLHGGLNKLAELLEVARFGITHQAGSDSLLTAHTFRKVKELYFGGLVDKYAGVLYGLGVEPEKDYQ